MKQEITKLKTNETDNMVSMDPFIGEVTLFAGNFAPRGWALCNGQLLAISQNTALFSILGTTYGGDGRTTFALPDLRGRSIVGAGRGPGLSDIRLGQKGGQEYVTLTTMNLPSHTHSALSQIPGFQVDSETEGEEFTKGNNSFLSVGNSSNTTLNSAKIQINNTGGQQSFYNRNPFLSMNYIIALQGIFPSRS